MKKIICLLVVLITFSFPSYIFGQITSQNDELIRKELSKYNVGTKLDIKLKKSGAVVTGKLAFVSTDNFVITDNTNNTQTILFSEVNQIKKVNHKIGLTIIHTIGKIIVYPPLIVYYFIYCSTHDCA